MRIKKSQLKELIRRAVMESDEWWNKLEPDEQAAYIKAHPKSKKAQDAKKKKGKEKMVRNAAGDMVPASKVAGHPDFKKDDKPHPGERDPSVRASREKPSDDSGGPSYSNVPKGAKSSKQAKVMKQNDATAKKINPNLSNSKDLVMRGMADDIDEFMNEIPDEGQDFDKADELLNLVRDNEQGMRDDDDDMIDDYKKGILKVLNTPGKSENGAMKAATDANKKMEIDVLNKQAEKGDGAQIDTEYGTVTWTNGDPDEDSFIATNEDGEEIEVDYADIVRFHNDNDSIMKNLRKESIKESTRKRCTVKEVKKWMKTLEENRYKKTYASDARRVSWFVNNNMSEDYESMPVSMRKKWTKAQYGRERYLAKEYLKHLNSKEINESKVRKVVRTIIRKQLNEGKKMVQLQIPVRDKLKVDKILKKSGGKIGKHYDIGVGKAGTFILELDRRFEDKVLELMIKNRVQVKEV